MTAGLAHMAREKEPVELFLRMPLAERSSVSALHEVSVASSTGRLVPLSDIVRTKEGTEEKTIYHKNLKRVVYV